MTPEDQTEYMAARQLVEKALRLACYHAPPQDREAVAVAMLAKALELATPDMTPACRAGLMFLDL